METAKKCWGKTLCGGNSAQKAGEQSQSLAKETVSFMLALDFLHQNQKDSAKPTKSHGGGGGSEAWAQESAVSVSCDRQSSSMFPVLVS